MAPRASSAAESSTGSSVTPSAGAPAGAATSSPPAWRPVTDFDAADCVDLAFRTDAAGIVQPMFPHADETTAWPDGAMPMPDGSIVFYMVKSYRTSPTHADVGAIGLGMIPAGSLTGVRLTEKIWDGQSGFYGNLAGARSPIRIGDDVYVYINTDEGNYLAARPHRPDRRRCGLRLLGRRRMDAHPRGTRARSGTTTRRCCPPTTASP